MKDFVEGVFEDLINNIHTIKPCIVKSVNYSNNTVDVDILTQTRLQDEIQEEFPTLYDVPIMVLSAGGGSSRITLPIKIGDNVVVLMSDRSFYNLITETNGKERVYCDEFKTHDLFPILAIPCFYTFSTAKEIDASNTIIENGSTKITVEPSGKVVIDASQAEINCNTIVNGNLNVNGDTTISGITTSNSVVSQTTTTSQTISAATGLTVAGQEMNGHIHDVLSADFGVTGAPKSP